MADYPLLELRLNFDVSDLERFVNRLYFHFFRELTKLMAGKLKGFRAVIPDRTGQLRQALHLQSIQTERELELALTVDLKGFYWHLVNNGRVIETNETQFERAIDSLAPIALEKAIAATRAELGE